MAPSRPFDFRRLGELASGGGSQQEVIRRFRGEGFRGGNDALRGLVKAIRGVNVSFRQLIAAINLLVRVKQIRGNVIPVPTTIDVTIRSRYRYKVVRNQLGRGDETLLSGRIEENRNYTFPIARGINGKLLAEQALARAEERVSRLVADAGLAQAGNYLIPDIVAEPIAITAARFSKFQR